MTRDYSRLQRARSALGAPTTLAFTTLGAPEVRDDIIRRFALTRPQLKVFGFTHSNLFLHVEPVPTAAAKPVAIDALARRVGGPGLVYCTTHTQAEELAPELAQRAGLRVGVLHHALTDSERALVHTHFAQGAFDCLVLTPEADATLCVDHVRFVVHAQVPANLECLARTIGRTGRDGLAVHALMLYRYADTAVHERRIHSRHPDRWLIEGVYRLLLRRGVQQVIRIDIPELCRELGRRVDAPSVQGALALLCRAGHLARLEEHRGWVVLDRVHPHELRLDYQHLGRQAELERERLKQSIFFATSRRCRNEVLLSYLGDRQAQRCGHCDRCTHNQSTQVVRRALARLKAIPEPVTPLRCVEPPRTVLRKILSCVARLRGRFRMRVVGAVLSGSRSRQVLDARLDRISTYGLLGYLKRRDVDFLVERCEHHGLIQVDARQFCSLTPLGRELMTRLHAPIPKPLQVVLTRVFPKPPEQTTPWHPATPASESLANITETLETTRRLMREEMDIDRVASRRQIRPLTIQKHLLQLAKKQRCPDLGSLVDGALLDRVRITYHQLGSSSWRVLRDALEDEMDERTLTIHLAHLLQSGQLRETVDTMPVSKTHRPRRKSSPAWLET